MAFNLEDLLDSDRLNKVIEPVEIKACEEFYRRLMVNIAK